MKELEKVAKNKYGEGYELVCVLQEAMYWKTNHLQQKIQNNLNNQ